MALPKKTASQKMIALLRNYGPSDIAELDAEIDRLKNELERFRRLREVVGMVKPNQQPHLTAALRGSKAVAPVAEVDDDDGDDEPQFATVVNEADRLPLRRKIVTLLKEFGVRRNDSIARELEVTKEVVLDLLAHVWFAKANNAGGFTLTAEGHIEANRLAGK